MKQIKEDKRMFTKLEELHEYLEDTGNEHILVFSHPDYVTAFIGLTDDQAVYDFDLMAASLVEEDGMELLEAIEFIEFNTIRSLPYRINPPIIINRVPVVQDEY